MSLSINPFILGMLETNTYLVADTETLEAAVIDPAANSQRVLDEINRKNLRLSQIWITHAHFDHTDGVPLCTSSRHPSVPVYLHPADMGLYESGGGAADFGFRSKILPVPDVLLEDGQILRLGKSAIKVLHTPGHSPGHVVFYAAEDGVAFCGDLIFKMAVGRADFRGGNYEHLLESIHTRILTLPPATRLLPGHGPETTVAYEAEMNPFLK